MSENMTILVYSSMALSFLFYAGERVVPWFVALILGAFSGVMFIAAGVYWIIIPTGIPVFAWLFVGWGVVNLVLCFFFLASMLRQRREGYPGDEELYGADAV